MMRKFFAPLMLRFKSTDDLLVTYNFLCKVDESKLDTHMLSEVDRSKRIIFRELLRRNPYA